MFVFVSVNNHKEVPQVRKGGPEPLPKRNQNAPVKFKWDHSEDCCQAVTAAGKQCTRKSTVTTNGKHNKYCWDHFGGNYTGPIMHNR